MRIAIIILLLGLGGKLVVHERRLSAELVTENARHRTEAEQLSVRIRELEREIVRAELDITNAQKTPGWLEVAAAAPSPLTNHAAAVISDASKSGNQSKPDFYLHKRHLSAIGLSALTPELRLSDEIAAVL